MTVCRCAALLTVGVLLLAGCADSTREQPPADVRLSASLTQYRVDEGLHRVQVKLSQREGAEAVEVLEVAVRLPGFEDGPPRELASSTRPGAVLDLPAEYGAAVCPEGDAPAVGSDSAAPAGTATAVLRIEGHDAAVELEMDDPNSRSALLWRRECSVRAALAVVPLELGADWARRSADGSGAESSLVSDGVLTLGPVTDGHSVQVTELRGTTMYGIETTGGVGLPRLEDGERVELPVTVMAARCDPHAVGESKRGYAFGVRVGVGGEEPVLVTVSPSEPARVQMESVLLERCGLD